MFWSKGCLNHENWPSERVFLGSVVKWLVWMVQASHIGHLGCVCTIGWAVCVCDRLWSFGGSQRLKNGVFTHQAYSNNSTQKM